LPSDTARDLSKAEWGRLCAEFAMRYLTQGRGASRGRIERLMRCHGIRAIMARPRRVRTTDSRHDFSIAPNLLERNFTADAPQRGRGRAAKGGCC
jgi:transposase InsO family protein